MKTFGIVCLVFGIVLFTLFIIEAIRANYDYKYDVYSYWNLADKSSTIEAKSDYINKFVLVLNNPALLSRHNALIFKTPDNSFNKNYEALKTLQLRLNEIKTMDISTFQYQTAIQQITAQEQGEANEMLCVIRGCWMLEYHPFVWKWWSFISCIVCIGIIALGSIFIASSIDY